VQGLVQGSAMADLNGAWSGPLHLNVLARDWQTAAKRSLTGRGRIHITKLSIMNSPFLDQILSSLEADDRSAEGELRVDDMRITDGRVSYDLLLLKLKRYEIQFKGWIDFDGRMELTMTVPLNEKMLRKYPKLDRYVDQRVDVPITGTLASPRLDFGKVFEDLLRKELEKSLFDRFKKKLKGGD
jgi:hypothetical protein